MSSLLIFDTADDDGFETISFGSDPKINTELLKLFIYYYLLQINNYTYYSFGK